MKALAISLAIVGVAALCTGAPWLCAGMGVCAIICGTADDGAIEAEVDAIEAELAEMQRDYDARKR